MICRKKAIILARVSTKEQMEEGHSIPAQVQRLVEYTEKNDFEVIAIHKISESSTKESRKEFEKVITLANPFESGQRSILFRTPFLLNPDSDPELSGQ